MIQGIDVSAYQPSTYSTAGLDFVFTKVTEGLTYINPKWAQQRDHAKADGLVWGAYHYPHMANDPQTEADYFLNQVAWQPGDVIVLDWEGYDTANTGVPKARQLAYRDAWLKYVKGKLPAHRVGMYCNTDYWLNVDQTSTCGDFLWIATGGKPAGQPGIQHPWTFHQYSTAGGIDHDVAAFPSRAALTTWAQALIPKPTPTPIPSAPTYAEDDMLSYLPIPAGTDVDIPVEPAGTLKAPQGGARNGPMWLGLAAQGADASVAISLHTAKGWGAPATSKLTHGAGKHMVDLPTDGSVDVVRVHATGAPLIGYIVGRQVA